MPRTGCCVVRRRRRSAENVCPDSLRGPLRLPALRLPWRITAVVVHSAEVNNSVTIAGATCESLIEQRMECMDTTTSLPPTDSAPGTSRLKSSILSAITSCRANGTRGEFGQLRVETEQLRRELAEIRTRASVAEQRVADLTAMLNDVREQRDNGRLSWGSLLTDQGRRAPRWWRWRRPKRIETRLQITDMRENPSDLKIER